MSENDKTPLLDTIALPADLRKFPENKLRQVADELRQEMIDAVSIPVAILARGSA